MTDSRASGLCRTCRASLPQPAARGREREFCNGTCRSRYRRVQAEDDVVRCEMRLGDWLCNAPAEGKFVLPSGTDTRLGWRSPSMARLRRITRDALPHQYRNTTRADVYLCAACQPLAERWLQERLQAHGIRPAWRKSGPRERFWSKRSKS